MPPPPPPARERHYTEWYAGEYAIQMGEMERTCNGLNRVPIMAELPYYDSLLIQHLGDPMHQEANVVKNLLQHLFDQVDKPKHRKACEEFGVHGSAWIQVRPNETEVIWHATWVPTRDERSVFRQRVQDIRTPTGYGSNFRAAFAHNHSSIWGKGLKTHDYHRLIQDIIPIIMLDFGDDILRRTICSLSSSAPVSSFVEDPDVREMDEYAYGGKQKKKLDRVQYLQAHTFILHNSEIMQP
ncbi:hypothetical protein R1sor_009909 [Riccia sorocarpa]|uniref:Uncharacterized protein n=1 Tax=Riccia sorocarpa TaxID=122646 RepID=A0ABD3HWK3_9MARC